MRVSRIELNNFKRFTHLVVEGIPRDAKLIVLVGPNGTGKTSLLEALNHYHKYYGHGVLGERKYLSKLTDELSPQEWYQEAEKEISMSFHDARFKEKPGQAETKGHFYFRSAYRNEPSFSVNSLMKQSKPSEEIRLNSLIQNDQTVSSNYQRLVSKTIGDVYDIKNSQRTVEDLRNEILSRLNDSLGRVFDDFRLTSLGDPLVNGGFYFTKGTSENFDYCNLSAGEKSAFDLILDLVIQSVYYPNAIYAIDEPEAHMHTAIQSLVLRELYQLIPDESQLWISTHSIGMLQEAAEIKKSQPNSVVFLDFGDRDFDDEQVLHPTRLGKAFFSKFYELAFGDSVYSVMPSRIVICEGSAEGNNRRDFDQSIFDTIFRDDYYDVLFCSGGSCSEVEAFPKNAGNVVESVLATTKIIKVVDRDDRTEEEIDRLRNNGVKVLSRRSIESFLLDDEVIRQLCEAYDKVDKVAECLGAKKKALEESAKRGNPTDDLKSASGEFYTSVKRILDVTGLGSNADAFMRDKLAPLIKSNMMVYKELEQDLFGE